MWLTREMIGSPAFRNLSRAGYQALMRIAAEHMNHAATANGALIVTFLDFAKYGVPRASIAPAIDELEAFGWVDVVRGRGGNAEFRQPSRFRLTWLSLPDGSPPTDRWRRIDEATAEAIRGRLLEDRGRRAKVSPPPDQRPSEEAA